jgi:creatinine amidohydrolase
MHLALATWPEVEEYLATSKGIIIPVGSTEQHGPIGLLGTDYLCPEAIAREAGERLECMVGPPITIGMSQHHLAFAGTVSLRPSTLVAVLVDVIQSLAAHGFERFLFLNGHGGNEAPLETAFSEVYSAVSLDSDRRRVHCRFVNWCDGPRVVAVIERLFGAQEGSHGTPSEVALTYHLHPQLARSEELQPAVPPDGEILDAWDYRQRYPDGRMGANSSLATPANGQEVYAAAVDDVVELYGRFAG